MMARSLASITKIPANRIAEAKALRRIVSTPIVYVEGRTDRIFFKNILRDSVCVQKMDNKRNVLEIVRACHILNIEYKQKQTAIAVVDLDYDRIFDELITDSSWVYYIDSYDETAPSRDLEILLMRSPALYKVLCHYELEGNHDSIRDRLLAEGSVIGAADVFRQSLPEYQQDLMEVKEWRHLEFKKFYDCSNNKVDIDKFINYAFGTKFLERLERSKLQNEIHRLQSLYSPAELSRGHDVVQMLAAYIHKSFDRTFLKRTEDHLLLAYEESFFTSSNVGKELLAIVSRLSSKTVIR